MIKTKIFNKKTGIVYLEIFLLMTMIFSFSYLIYENTGPSDQENNKIKEINFIAKNNILKIIAGFIFGKLKQPILQMVSAEVGTVCCERTNAGVWWEDAPQAECDVSNGYSVSPGSCDDTGLNVEGCCYNPAEGLCIEKTYRENCIGGDWQQGSCGDVSDCRKACCIYSGEATWATETECEIIAANHLDRSWDTTIGNSVECILTSRIQGVGACVQELGNERDCKFVPEAECLGNDVYFYENYLCTHPDVNSTCQMTNETTCDIGKDEVYFLDSCGNMANIYDVNNMSNIEYWKTKIRKIDSCNYGDLFGNANSPGCGNCKYIDGSKCGTYSDVEPTYGENICIDLSCEDVEIDGNIVTKQNGESWCVFDGAIDVGKVNDVNIARDVVGSRYWRHVCLDGEERIEPCADYRNEVCSESIDDSTGRSYSQCRINRWRDCINRELDICEENSDCWKKHVGIDEFVFDVCLPKYPGGFDIFETDANRNGQTICNMGTQTCHVVYVKPSKFASCKCEYNCGCEEESFSQEMNSFCASLGDCGGYVNIEGKYTDEGYTLSGSPKLPGEDINEYVKFANILLWPNQIVDAGAFVASPSYLSGIGPLAGEGPDPGWNLDAAGAVTATAAVVVIVLTILEVIGPIGWIIGIGLAVLTWLFGEGEVCKEIDIVYSCDAWQPPVGGDDCEKCNGDDQKPCTPYRCKSLGKACEFINEGTTEELCIASIDDKRPPEIIPLYTNLTENLVYENIQTNGFEIRNTNRVDGCLEASNLATFGIQTPDEHSVCKFDLSRGTEFSEKPQYLGDVNYLIKNHTHSMILPNPSLLAYTYNIPTEFILERYGDLEMFIECQDNYGNNNGENEYLIKFCIKEGPDHTAPYIRFAEPASEDYLKYGDSDVDVKLWIDESAECKYTEIDSSVTYDNMENNMSCKTRWTEYEFPRGYPCEFSLTNITNDKSVWVRCKDKPWLPDSNESRKVNSASTEYIVKVSDSELEIEDMSPDNGESVVFGVNPASLELKLKTSGGAQDGKAICQWSEVGEGWRSPFGVEPAIYHISSELPLYAGDYSFDYSCIDVAGNTAESSSSFEIEFDETGPRIVRIYFDGGLKVVTKEDAECRYSFERAINWNNLTIMSGNGFEHIANWELKTYYVQCEDEFNNKGGKKRIKAYSLLPG
jgi:hypothetical protein